MLTYLPQRYKEALVRIHEQEEYIRNMMIFSAQIYKILLENQESLSRKKSNLLFSPLFIEYINQAGIDKSCNSFTALLCKNIHKAHILTDIADTGKANLPFSSLVALYLDALATAPEGEGKDRLTHRLILFLYTYSIDDTLLLHLLKEQTTRENAWQDTLFRRKNLRLMVLLLLLHGDNEQATELLRLYIKKHGKSDLHMFLPVAWLAHSVGISSGLIRQAAYVYEHVLLHRTEETFKNLIKYRKVAIVGSGPQELGRGRGGEIDGHDVVIRINASPVNGKTSVDYGTKTDVWCKNAAAPYYYGTHPEAQYLLLLDNFERFHSNKERITQLAATIKNDGRIIIAPERSAIQALFRPFDYSFLSSGLLAAAFVRSLNKHFSQANMFGFSCLHNEYSNYSDMKQLYYYDASLSENINAYKLHSLTKERHIIAQIFYDNTPDEKPQPHSYDQFL